MALEPALAIDPQTRRVRLRPGDPAFFTNPYPAYRALQERCPVFFWEEYGHWCFSRFADVNALLRDRRFGREILHVASRQELGWPAPEAHLAAFDAVEANSLLEREPPVHTRLRKLVNRAFVSREVERLRPRITSLAHTLIDGLEAERSVGLLERFATPIPVTIIAELLGVPVAMAPELLAWSHAMVAMYQHHRSRAVEEAAVRATGAFVDFVRAHIEARRRRPGDALIDRLIEAEDEGHKLSGDELVSTCILLLNAGHEATVHAIGNSVHAILASGVDRASALADLPALVEELLRYDAPLHMFTRYALQDLEFAGVGLRKGDKVGLLLGAANRDPSRFTDPDRVDPARADQGYVSFGAGIHFCVGAPLARLELEVALHVLFQRLPGLQLAAPARFKDSWHFHGLERLEVGW